MSKKCFTVNLTSLKEKILLFNDAQKNSLNFRLHFSRGFAIVQWSPSLVVSASKMQK